MLCKHPKRGRELFVHCPSGNMSKGCNKVSFESFQTWNTARVYNKVSFESIQTWNTAKVYNEVTFVTWNTSSKILQVSWKYTVKLFWSPTWTVYKVSITWRKSNMKTWRTKWVFEGSIP